MTDEPNRRQELTYWYTEMGYVVHQLGERVERGTVEPHHVDALRDLLDRFEELADELDVE